MLNTSGLFVSAEPRGRRAQHTATVPFKHIFLQVGERKKKRITSEVGRGVAEITVNNDGSDGCCSCPAFAVYLRPNTHVSGGEK